MGDKTRIEWVQNEDGTRGTTWNMIGGCTEVSPGCTNCYARRASRRMMYNPSAPKRYAGTVEETAEGLRWTGRVNLDHDELDRPLRWRKPRRVFVASMADLFHPDVPLAFVARVWETIHAASAHTFMVLTKRPVRMWVFLSRIRQLFDDWPVPNVWLGTTVEGPEQTDRIEPLLKTPAVLHFVSCEPLLAEPDLEHVPFELEGRSGVLNALTGEWDPACVVPDGVDAGCVQTPYALNWVIAGGESGPGARVMHPDWARGVLAQCQRAAVPFFMKQLGAWIWYGARKPLSCMGTEKAGQIRQVEGEWYYRGDGKAFECFPPDLRVREFPRLKKEVDG